MTSQEALRKHRHKPTDQSTQIKKEKPRFDKVFIPLGSLY